MAEEPIKRVCKLNLVGWKPPNDLVDGVNFLGIQPGLTVAEEPIKRVCKLNPAGWKPPNDLVEVSTFTPSF